MNTFTDESKSLLGGDNLPYMESPSLRLDKFVHFDKNNKKDQLEVLISTYNRRPQFPEKFTFSKIAKSLKIEMQLASRLIINQAGGLLENSGICLHRHFGYPYIPGSAVKGIARHAAWCAWYNETDSEKKKGLALKIAFTFGFPTGDTDYLDDFLVTNFPDFFNKKKRYETFSGSVAFLPACPKDNAQLACDVLTPHGGNDYTNPVPNFFIAVEKGSRWVFTIRKVLNRVLPDNCNTDTLLDFADQYLKIGLSSNGAGAKTVAGYGCFEKNASAPKNEIELMLATPGFFGGAVLDKKDDTDLRVSALRGMLRLWWKTLYKGLLNTKDVESLESLIWGSTSGSSMIVLKLTTIQKQVSLYDYKDRFRVKDTFANAHNIESGKTGLFYLSYGMNEMSHNEKRQRYYIEPGAKWTLSIDVRNSLSQYTLNGKTVKSNDIKNQAVIALSLLCKFGGIGSKSRKGFGSLYWKGALPLEECQENAKAFCDKLGIVTSEKYNSDYSWNSAMISELTLPVTDTWTAIDRLGLTVQNFAASYKHEDEKAVLGLPRQIHGPQKRPMGHQNEKTHQPPQPLMPDLRTAQNGAKTRFASPIWYHFEPTDGKICLRITAFPSNMIRNDSSISKKIFSELINTIENELPGAFAKKIQNAPVPRNSNKISQNNNINQVSGIKSTNRIQAKLLAEKTKKGGWIAENNLLGKGPIQNAVDVPDDKKPGDVVELIVAIAKKGAAQYKWPK